MPSMNFLTRLEETCRWYDWHLNTITDVHKKLEFQQKCIDNFFDLFALIANELRDLKGMKAEMERPYWQRMGLPTFVEKKPPNPDDPELGLRG